MSWEPDSFGAGIHWMEQNDMKSETAAHYSRRNALRAGLALVAGAGAASTAFAQATEKVAQNLVQYQQTPKDGQKCSLCVNWQPPNACKVVAGTINPDGWCVAFAPKSGG
jgi:hypothetical protein